MGRSPALASLFIYKEMLCEAGLPYPPIQNFCISKGCAVSNFRNK